jgi:predicted DNA-binding transcriptional regulator AlpA
MLTIEEVLEIVPVTRGTLYRMEKQKKFPESHYISENRRVWFEDEVIAWQNGLPPGAGKPRGRHIKRQR